MHQRGDFLKSFKNTSFFPQVQLFLCLLWLSISSFLTLFPITTAAINTRFFFWLFDITLIAMHILCLFKTKRENTFLKKRIFRTVWYRKLFFLQLFEQHPSFENSCRSQFFVTVVQILCFLSLMKSSIEAIFHTMCYICVWGWVNMRIHAHIYTHVKIYIYICVWSGKLTFSYLDLRTYFRHLLRFVKRMFYLQQQNI